LEPPDAFLKASELRAYLEKLGVGGVAAEVVVRETAPARHERRVEQAREAALIAASAILEKTQDKESPLAPLAGLLLILDEIGLVSRQKDEKSQRVPFLGHLGKGRKQASDGPAWSAAIRQARERLTFSPFGFVEPTLKATRNEVFLTLGQGGGTGSISLVANPVILPWLKTLVREGLRRSLGMEGWHSIPRVRWEGLPHEWGAALNALYGDHANR
jgi:hypothetical protein